MVIPAKRLLPVLVRKAALGAVTKISKGCQSALRSARRTEERRQNADFRAPERAAIPIAPLDFPAPAEASERTEIYAL